MHSKRLNTRLILLFIAISLVIAAGPVKYTYAMADDDKSTETESTDKTTKSATDESNSKSSKTDSTGTTKKENNSKNADTDTTDNKSAASNVEDIIEENAAGTHGNASLGDAVKTSGQMDFYTIRTANNQTYYLVVDHSGAVDNVYLLSTIDANDLEDFVDSGAARNGGVVMLPDSKKDTTDSSSDEEAGDADSSNAEKKQTSDVTKSSRTAGLVSLAVILAAGGVGVAAYMRSRKRSKEISDYSNESLEYDDMLPRVREDEDL